MYEGISHSPRGHSNARGVSVAILMIGGREEGGRMQPSGPHVHVDETTAAELTIVVAGQLLTPSLVQDVTTVVDMIKAVEAATKELLCLGLNRGTFVGTLVGMLLRVADEGAMGPFRRAELRMVLLGAGPNILPLPPLICSSTLAQLKIWSGSTK